MYGWTDEREHACMAKSHGLECIISASVDRAPSMTSVALIEREEEEEQEQEQEQEQENGYLRSLLSTDRQ